MAGSSLSDKEKMLGIALYAHGVKKQNTIQIMMLLNTEEMVDDMTWFIANNPKATDEELVAVAYQLVKESEGK